jgi:cation-transporting ATPase 13A3/4/5
MALPCDALLLSGEVLLNECSITGESIPVPKFQIDSTKELYFKKERNYLYEGTVVIKSKPTKYSTVRALVLRTGYSSFKGQIVRSVLFPVK